MFAVAVVWICHHHHACVEAVATEVGTSGPRGVSATLPPFASDAAGRWQWFSQGSDVETCVPC
eukprot:8386487-Lingulodinium_polyedra.AAC.1